MILNLSCISENSLLELLMPSTDDRLGQLSQCLHSRGKPDSHKPQCRPISPFPNPEEFLSPAAPPFLFIRLLLSALLKQAFPSKVSTVRSNYLLISLNQYSPVLYLCSFFYFMNSFILCIPKHSLCICFVEDPEPGALGETLVNQK